MWTLSGFADEIDPDLRTQCEVARELGLNFIEFRSAWDTGVLDLTDEELARARDLINDHNLGVSSIGSPIGKIFIDDDFEPHLDRMRRAVHTAQVFGAPYIRVYSFLLRPEMVHEQVREEVVRRMRALVQIAEPAGITLLHENDEEIYGDGPQRCLDLVTTVDSAHLKLAWDPANFVQVGIRPFTDGYAMLRDHLAYIQIKDARSTDGTIVPPGQGDGEIRATIRALRADNFEGFFSIEPHLESHLTGGEDSGADLFRTAWKAFTDLLREESVAYA